jgi:two-component system cell cycle sensor histidine kinase/response regulator CckA
MTNLLVVDDKQENLYMLRILLEGNGYRVETATNGVEALERARRDPPSMIVADILMPVMDGFTLCREWRKDERLKAIPFVFYTATYTDPKDEDFALSLGADRFLVKPMEPGAFVDMVRQVLGEAEEGRLRVPDKLTEDEPVYLKTYSERLVKKLEDKMLELERAHRRLAAQYQASTALAALKSRDEIVLHVLRTVIEAMGFDKAIYFEYDPQRQEFRLAEVVGLAEGLAATPQQDLVFRLGEERGLVGLVGQTRRPLIVADTREDARWVPMDSALRSALFVPVIHDDELLGVTGVVSAESDHFSPADADDLMTLANNVGIALKNAQLVERLSQSEARYRRLAENAPDVIYHYRLKPTPGFEYVSPAATEVFGYTPEEYYADPDLSFKLVHPEDRPLLEQHIRGAGSSRVPLSVRWVRRDGEIIWTEHRAVPIYDQVGDLVALQGIVRDVTERVRAAEQLRRQHGSLRTLIDNVPDHIFFKDAESRYLAANVVMARLMGVADPDDLVGKTDFDFISHDRASRYRADDQAIIESGRPLIDREEFRETAAGHVRWHQTSKLPLYDERGQVVGIVGIGRDVTEHKRAREEREHLQAQLLQAQKMEAVGQLTAGVAHDFNNALTVVNGFAELLEWKLPPQDPLQGHVKRILNAARNAADLVRQLMAFSRKQVVEVKVVDLNAALSDVRSMLEHVISEDIRLEMVLSRQLWPVRVDPAHLQQVIVNLASNARDAMPHGGRLVITAANLTLVEPNARTHPDVQRGEYVMLSVSDTGCGMSPDVQARIFEPFFTTKELGKGTGLGLATVYGIVKQSRGEIRVSSQVGAGTTFRVYLPRVLEHVSPSPEGGSAAAGASRGGETILLVEDDATVREFAQSVLEMEGYQVIEVAAADEALQAASEWAGGIHLLVTDAVMPGMSGMALAAELTTQRPEMRVLCMSGYVENVTEYLGLPARSVAFLQKPFGASDLTRKVRLVLDAPDDDPTRGPHAQTQPGEDAPPAA